MEYLMMKWPYEAQQKKTVGRLHYDVEKMIDNLVRSYVEGICRRYKDDSTVHSVNPTSTPPAQHTKNVRMKY
jgi:hypothetical protein